MKYDDAAWHYGGDFPKELPQAAGATHIAMFVAWAVLNGLAGEFHTADFPKDLQRLRDRSLMPGEWFLLACDGKFTDEDLNDEGNNFAKAYYDNDDGIRTDAGSYLIDYEETFSTSTTLYDVPDTWTTYSKLEPIIWARYDAWRRTRK